MLPMRPAVIARSEATKQSRKTLLSAAPGLPRYARNDVQRAKLIGEPLSGLAMTPMAMP
jgi:hypothetical protein